MKNSKGQDTKGKSNVANVIVALLDNICRWLLARR